MSEEILVQVGDDLVPLAEVHKRDTTHGTDHTAPGKSQASQVNYENLKRVFDDACAAVRVSESKRDLNQSQRFRYELNWRKLRAAAENYVPQANARGIKVYVPVYHAPPSTSESSVEYTPAPASDGKYEETRGYASGRGRPGTAVPEVKS